MRSLKFSRIVALIVIAFGAYKAFGPGYTLWSSEPKPYEITEFTVDGSPHKVRDRMFLEEGIMAGSLHRFEFLHSDGSWKEVFSFRFDDPAHTREHNIQFKKLANGSLAIVAGWMLALSNDEGTTWNVWDAARDLKSWQCCNYKLIQDLEIDPSGTGIMNVNVIAEERRERPLFRTRDGGRTWID